MTSRGSYGPLPYQVFLEQETDLRQCSLHYICTVGG